MFRQLAALSATLSALQVCAGTLTIEITDPSANPTIHSYTHTGVLPGTVGPVTFGAGSEPDVTIELGAVTGRVRVRIFDSVTSDGLIGIVQNAALPQLGIGRLRLNGSASSTARVDLLVADGDQVGFPSSTTFAEGLQPGLTTLGGTLNSNASSNGGYAHDYDAAPWATSNSAPSYGGPVFADWGNADLKGIIIPDPSLRRQTVLAAVVSQDVCPGFEPVNEKTGRPRSPAGRIEVGQVLRLAAPGVIQQNGAVLCGNINANIIADSVDQFLSYDLCGGSGVVPTGFHGRVALKPSPCH